LKRLVYWGNADQLLDFTTMENTAEYTAPLDAAAPRHLRIAGDAINANGLKKAESEATSKEFRLLRAGSLGSMQTMITVIRTLFLK
jgi:hypothetical protein